MRVAGLFAGIGGIELGLHAAGHSTALLCELDPAARAVLRAHFSDTRLHDDVRTLTRLPDGVDVLAGGFPCQDLSQAGRTRGIAGERSGLVHEIFRLLRTHDVPHVLLENVSFMRSLGRGHAMRVLTAELELLGYRWAYRVVDTRAFGLPQRRQRLYLLASRSIDPASLLLSEDVCASGNTGVDPDDASHTGRACGFYWTEGTRGLGWAVDAVPTLKGGSTIGIASPPAIWLPDGRIVTPDLRDAERLQGFPEDWTLPAEAIVRRSFRWKLVGNAVSVPVAGWIGRLLASPSPGAEVRTRSLDTTGGWPTAACGGPGRAPREALVSMWPVNVPRGSLVEFLRHEPKPLSLKAASGFLARFRAGRLRRPDGFLAALERHVETLAASSAPDRAA
ncbi:DNA cytosine methyltransferase [Opitutales bacterium ASA1]|uniref:DNA cytosine methyltransferase n=1 Tax=Congregicoccus parvus TaxID=3081749 RepID=UPI002B28D060|nr:DNA cytosine methyltransferase [Opitutales bacterium ASA1]